MQDLRMAIAVGQQLERQRGLRVNGLNVGCIGGWAG